MAKVAELNRPRSSKRRKNLPMIRSVTKMKPESAEDRGDNRAMAKVVKLNRSVLEEQKTNADDPFIDDDDEANPDVLRGLKSKQMPWRRVVQDLGATANKSQFHNRVQQNPKPPVLSEQCASSNLPTSANAASKSDEQPRCKGSTRGLYRCWFVGYIYTRSNKTYPRTL